MKTDWTHFLESRDICHADYEGNMPCDNGAVCDKCHSPEIQVQYRKYLESLESMQGRESIIRVIRRQRQYITNREQARNNERLLVLMQGTLKRGLF